LVAKSSSMNAREAQALSITRVLSRASKKEFLTNLFVRRPSMTLEECLVRPGFFPVTINAARRVVSFAEIDEARLRKIGFHDRGHLGRHKLLAVQYDIPLETAIKFFSDIPSGASDPLYLFQTSFCGSTLLARALDFPGKTFCYREPNLLYQLAIDRHYFPEQKDWDQVISMCLRLLSRTENRDEKAIVNLHSAVFAVANDLFDCRNLKPSSKALFIFSGLADFIGSILKRDERRVWARNILSSAFHQHPLILGAGKNLTTDADHAAMLWLCQMWYYKQLVGEDYQNPRVYALSSEQLFSKPAETLIATSERFSLGISSAECEMIANGPAFSLHSKTRLPFSNDERLVLQAATREKYSADIDAALKWISTDEVCAELLNWPIADICLY